MFSLESENKIKLGTLMLDLNTNDVIGLNIPYPPKLIKVIDDFLTPLLRPSIMVKFCRMSEFWGGVIFVSYVNFDHICKNRPTPNLWYILQLSLWKLLTEHSFK